MATSNYAFRMLPSTAARDQDEDIGTMPSPRTLDDYLETASRQDASGAPHDPYVQWRYWLVFLSLGVANASDAAEILCLSYLLSEPNFDHAILRSQAWRGGLLAATVFLGMLFGGLIVGALGDYKGRRPLLLLGLATNCVCGLLSAFAPDIITLSLLRLVAGVGIGATVPPLFTLCSELAPPADRGFWVSVAAGFWMVGSVYVALVGWWLLGGTVGTDSHHFHSLWWRVFALACALPSACGTFLVYTFVPESPRFLALQGQYEQAAAVAHQLAHAMQFIGLPLMVQELRYHYPPQAVAPPTSLAQLATIPHRTTITARMQEWTPDSASLFLHTVAREFCQGAARLYTPPLRQTTLTLQVIWFALSFGSYGLLTWINYLFVEVGLQNVYWNALLFAASNLPGNLLSAVYMDRTGRRSMLSASLLSAAFSLLVFALSASHASEEEGHAKGRAWIVVSACSFQAFSIAAWNAIDVLSTELFPTTIRATGMGLCAASGRIGAMMAQFVNGFLSMFAPVLLLLAAAASLLVAAAMPLWLPMGKTGEPVQDYVVDESDEDDEDEDSDDDEDEDEDEDDVDPKAKAGSYQQVI